MTTPVPPTTTTPSATMARASRGWFRLLLGVVAAMSVPVVAQLRLIVPIERTILFIGPAMAASALVAWWLGGRAWLFAAWAILAGWMLALPTVGEPRFDVMTRGWVLVLAAAFGIVSWMRPGGAFFPRALAATALTFAIAGVLVLSSATTVEGIGQTISGEFAQRLDASVAAFARLMETQEWQQWAARYPGVTAMVQEGEQQLPTIANVGVMAFPALLGLQSLAMLALGWAVFHRSSRTRIGPLLSPLSEFRFGDQLVWGVVLGVTLLVIPALRVAWPVGLNLVVFFGALYALRGLGVLSWFLAPGKPTPMLLIVAACLAGPVVAVFATGLGLADTWIDWRGRMRPAT